MIRVESLSFGYPGRQVLRGLNFSVASGDILGLIGPNGSGKTTLLRLLRGVLRPDQGQILIGGREVTGLNGRQRAQQMATVPQEAGFTFGFSVDEVVAMGRFARGGIAGRGSHRHAIDRALTLTDTTALRYRSMHTLSAGERQRVLLARALAQEAPLLLLDEASSNLDLDHRLEFAELLRRLNREQGTTIVQVSHDLDQTAELCQRVLLLDRDGNIAALGSPEQVYTAPLFRRVFRVQADIEKHPRTGMPRLANLRPLLPGDPPRS